jgi:hypothetical protein
VLVGGLIAVHLLPSWHVLFKEVGIANRKAHVLFSESRCSGDVTQRRSTGGVATRFPAQSPCAYETSIEEFFVQSTIFISPPYFDQKLWNILMHRLHEVSGASG